MNTSCSGKEKSAPHQKGNFTMQGDAHSQYNITYNCADFTHTAGNIGQQLMAIVENEVVR